MDNTQQAFVSPRLKQLKALVWLYFVLLIFEGALRKWVVPSLASPLLLIRDPVVILIYLLAIQERIFPRNGFITAIGLLAFLSIPVGLIQVANGDTKWAVLFYGLRTNFLYLPFIFVVPQIFTPEDVRKLGKFILFLAIPMTCLLVLQFKSPPDARINVSIGDGLQLESALGKIRPPGTFSFITGVVDFLALVAAFVAYGLSHRGSERQGSAGRASSKPIYPVSLVILAAMCLVAGIAVSGSRSALMLTLVVFSFFMVGLMLTGRFGSGFIKVTLAALLIATVVLQTDFLDEGIQVFSARWEIASEFEQQGGGIAGRFFDQLFAFVTVADKVPILGYGIGRGTNVGAQLLVGTTHLFLLAEGEWPRLILESGLVLGFALVGLRFSLMVWVGRCAFRAARQGELLPLVLFGAGALNLMHGQFGPATSLGFAVLAPALCLASIPKTSPAVPPTPPLSTIPPVPRRSRRSRVSVVGRGVPINSVLLT